LKLQAILPIAIIIIILTLSAGQSPVYAQTVSPQLIDRLLKLENFLVNQFNTTVGLVRESPDPSIATDYWLLSDNLIAAHVLAENHPDIASRINQTMQKFGIFTDGLHEALFGATIPIPPYTPIVKVVWNNSYVVKVEVRNNDTGKLQPDWVDYADLLVYAALSDHNAGNDQLAIYDLDRALDMWNGAGLWDRPTQEDGFYTTSKLALLMYTADILNQPIPYRAVLENDIWRFQRDDGGIRSHYLGNLTSHREANSETAGLVLLAYQFKIQKDRAEFQLEQQTGARAREIEALIVVAVVVSATGLITLALWTKRPRKSLLTQTSFVRFMGYVDVYCISFLRTR
jgi:hypothetical protein